MRLLLLIFCTCFLVSPASARQAPLPQWAQQLDSLFAANYRRQADSANAPSPDNQTQLQMKEVFTNRFLLPTQSLCIYDATFSPLTPDSLYTSTTRLLIFLLPSPERQPSLARSLIVEDTRLGPRLTFGFCTLPGYAVAVMGMNDRNYDAFLYSEISDLLSQYAGPTSQQPVASYPFPSWRVSPALEDYRKSLDRLRGKEFAPQYQADATTHPIGLRIVQTFAPDLLQNASSMAYVPICNQDGNPASAFAYYLFLQYPPYPIHPNQSFARMAFITLHDGSAWYAILQDSPVNGYTKIEIYRMEDMERLRVPAPTFKWLKAEEKLTSRLFSHFQRRPLFPHLDR